MPVEALVCERCGAGLPVEDGVHIKVVEAACIVIGLGDGIVTCESCGTPHQISRGESYDLGSSPAIVNAEIHLEGSGAVAVGPGSVAAGAGGVAIGRVSGGIQDTIIITGDGNVVGRNSVSVVFKKS